jgi:hypothetical protein
MRKERSFLPLPAPPTLIIVLMVAGCGASGNATSHLEQVFPASAYSDAPIKVSLLGSSFHPPVRVDTYSGAADVADASFQISLDPLRPVTGRRSVAGIDPVWKDATEIDALLPAGLLAGNYAVSLHDAGGNAIGSTATFTSLGPDIDPPHIVFLQPAAGTTFAPGDTFNVVVRVDDGAGRVRRVLWSRSQPSLSPSAPVPDPTDPMAICGLDAVGVCSIPLHADPGPDVVDRIDIRVDAEDEVGNLATASRRVQVASIPIIKSLAPVQGSTAGGTKITIYGKGLVPNLSQITVDGVSIEGVVDPKGVSIKATTAAHLPGGAMIAVSNGKSVSAGMAFMFIPPPILKLIDPPDAPADLAMVTIAVSGNNFRPETEFFWTQNGNTYAIPYSRPGNVLPVAPYELLLSSTRASLVLVPPVNEQPFDPGPITIQAHDPISGDSLLVDAFTFDAAP